jgi:putative redox protein
MFTARASGQEWVLDGRSEAGPSPVVALASALAGCLAIDIVHILTKGRFEVRSFQARLTGRRADTEPRRFVAIDVSFALDTGAPRDQVDRAIALSREKYCSVWHSLRQDIELTTSVLLSGSDTTLTPVP